MSQNKCLFSIYIEIPENKWDLTYESYHGDEVSKSERSHIGFEKYKKKLKKNHEEYAKAIGAEYILFGFDEWYLKFREKCRRWSTDICEYDIINFYKFNRAEYLSKYYDQLIFIDFDVVTNTDRDFWDEHSDQEFHVALNQKNDLDVTVDMVMHPRWNFNKRSPFGKKYNAYLLCQEHMVDCPKLDDMVSYNTAVMGFTPDLIEELNYFQDFGELIGLMEEMLADETMHPKVRNTLGRDNESVFTFRCLQRKLKHKLLDAKWHFLYDDRTPKMEDNHFCHIINKRFDLVLG